MTREEARQVLQTKIDNSPLFKDERDAFTMAIEALSVANLKEEFESAVPNCKKCAIKELWEETEKEDLVSVVRCRDCRHLYNKDFCSFFGSPTEAMDYCSHGERKEK